MPEVRSFTLNTVCDAIGADASAVRIRYRNGDIAGSGPNVDGSFIAPTGFGPGKGLAMPLEGAIQLAIAEALISAGMRIKPAYFIGLHFANFGAAPVTWDEKPAAWNAATCREAGKLFGAGKTWLVATIDTAGMPGDERFFYFSDADPAMRNGSDRADLETAALRVGEPVDGKPRILLNISDVCFNLAAALGFNRFEAFRGEIHE